MILQPMKDQCAINLEWRESNEKQYLKANCCDSFLDVAIHHLEI